jgi:ADP-heptose:LPS heptosyltransferase
MTGAVLIHRLGSLGDTVVALPALRLVARAFPQARRIMLTNFNVSSRAAPAQEVLEGTGLIDDYIRYPLGLRSASGLARLAAQVRAVGPDVVIYLPSPRGLGAALRDRLFFAACGNPRVVGMPWGSRGTSLRLADGHVEREGERLLRCLDALGTLDPGAPESYRLWPGEAALAQADAVLAPLRGRPLLAFSVGTKMPANDWEDVRWRPLLQALAARYPDHGVIAVGAREEVARVDELLAPWAGRGLNLCGDLRVPSSVAVLSRCQAFIGHDSGPLHLAAAAGTRCVGIFSSRLAPGMWFPFGDGHEVIYHPIACQGCGLERCEARAKACIRSIAVDEVVQAVARALGARGER